MLRRLIDLKQHYGTETLLEVLEANLEARSMIFNKTLLRQGRHVIFTYREEFGLVALDINPLGQGVVIKLSEEYLEKFVIDSDDYHDIVGVPYSERPRHEWDDALKEAEAIRDDKKKRNEIFGWATAIMSITAVVTVTLIRSQLKGSAPEPVKPTSKRK